jgi:hypothetical protein
MIHFIAYYPASPKKDFTSCCTIWLSLAYFQTFYSSWMNLLLFNDDGHIQPILLTLNKYEILLHYLTMSWAIHIYFLHLQMIRFHYAPKSYILVNHRLHLTEQFDCRLNHTIILLPFLENLLHCTPWYI